MAMRPVWQLSLGLGFGGLLLAAPQPVHAIDFYVNACCLATAPVRGGGEVRTVSSHVGSSTPHTATVRVTFKVTGPGNFQCQRTVEATGPFVNALTMPVHFGVTYPAKSQLAPGSLGRSSVYTVQAVTNNITPPPPPTPAPADVFGNNAHSVAYTFPSGGTPECVASPGPN